MPKTSLAHHERFCEIEEVSRTVQPSLAHSIRRFPPVPAEEIAFALTLFVAAANGQSAPPVRPDNSAELLDLQECRRVYLALCPDRSAGLPANQDVKPCARALSSAFLSLWQHYRNSEYQASICARVLNFHLLMVESAGSAIDRWVSPCPETPEIVMLHAAIIEAIATVPLNNNGCWAENLFLALVDSIGHTDEG